MVRTIIVWAFVVQNVDSEELRQKRVNSVKASIAL